MVTRTFANKGKQIMYQGKQIAPSKFSVNNTINIQCKKFIFFILLIYNFSSNYTNIFVTAILTVRIIIISKANTMKFDRNKLFKLKAALLKLSEVTCEDGTTLVTDGELEVGAEVFTNGEDGLIPASDGTFEYNGTVITVEGGVITAITEKPAETEETPAEEETVEENAEEETPAEEVVEETPAETESTEEAAQEATEEVVDVDALKTRIAELEALVEDLKKKLEEPVADSVEEEMKKDQKPQKQEMNYMAAIRKAKEIKIVRK